MTDENMEIKEEYCVWVNPTTKTIYVKETPNTKRVAFESDEARIKFAAKMVLKGFSVG